MKCDTLSSMNLSPYETITTNAMIRAKLHLWGGDGEREGQQPQGEQPNSSQQSGNEGEPQDNAGDDAKKSGGDPDGDDPAKDLEKKLNEERKQRIQLQRKLDKRDQEEAAVNASVEAERDDYKQKYEKLLKYVENDALETAIMKISAKKDKQGNAAYDWHDVEAVRTFIDKNNIRLDLDNNQVDGLDLELKRIAKEKPYLLAAKDQGGSGGSGNQGNQPPPQPPGTPASGGHPFGGNVRQRETDQKKLGAKYKIPGFGPGAQSVRPL